MTSTEFSERILSMQETLYRVSYSILVRACDREDAVQECIRIAWEKQGTLREERYMQTWIIRILIHECYRIERRRRRETPTVEFPERILPPDADRDLHDALLALSTSLRVPVVLHYLEGYPLADIAKALRLPTGTVKSRLSRARKLLKVAMLDEEVCRV